MYYGKETSRTSIKVYFSSFLQNWENYKPNWSPRGASGGPGGLLARPPPGRARHPGLRLRPHFGLKPSFCCRNFCYIFAWIILAPYLAISCVFFLGLFLPGKLSTRSRCHGFPKFPQGQVCRQRHQPLPRRGEESPPDPSCRGWCPPQRGSEGTHQGREHRGATEGDGT